MILKLSWNEVASALPESLITIVNQQAKRKNKQPNKDRLHLKTFWFAILIQMKKWEFKEKMRITRGIFDFNLKRISHLRHQESTYMAPNPIEDQRQLSLTIYRMAHGCWFKVLTGMFWVSQSLATETFNNVVKCMIFTHTMNLFAYQERK